MNKLSNFFIGCVSSLGVSNALPDTIQVATDQGGVLVDSFEALISLLSGILSAFLIDLFKRKIVDKKRKKGAL